MPFMKKKKPEEDEEIPHERVERNNRIVREVRNEPEYEEYDEEDEDYPKKQQPQQPLGLKVKMTKAELAEDLNAHAFVVNSVAARFTGLPPHIVDAEVRRICAGNMIRMHDINEALKH